ncbi:MAG TPA: hypothetical protein VFV17_09500 [Usitatibacteraceae bacterium]|nr:hypothetical protein [Usitatibacteraceae bacterium]
MPSRCRKKKSAHRLKHRRAHKSDPGNRDIPVAPSASRIAPCARANVDQNHRAALLAEAVLQCTGRRLPSGKSRKIRRQSPHMGADCMNIQPNGVATDFSGGQSYEVTLDIFDISLIINEVFHRDFE